MAKAQKMMSLQITAMQLYALPMTTKHNCFFCGGTFRIPDDDESYGCSFHPSREAALFDIASGKWIDLPMMPKSRGASSRGGPSAAAFRVRSKIYVFGGCDGKGRSLPPLCFNL